MSYTYADKKRASSPKTDAAPQAPALDALRSGAVKPTTEQMGHRVDLPDAMREKMESAFGADLGAVKLYESQAVADAGANAITQGSNIAFAPGMLDFTSFGGQSLLGHEISHVVSQARGEVNGSGFLNDHALEARADREGAMAAAGQQIAAPTAAMSGVTAAPSAAPMQASKSSSNKKIDRLHQINNGIQAGESQVSGEDMEWYFDTLSGLTDREIKMVGQRINKHALSLDKNYHRLPGSDDEKRLRASFSDDSTDITTYNNILRDFGLVGGSNSRGRNAGERVQDMHHELESRMSRSKGERINRGMALTGGGASNPFKDTEAGAALNAELEDALTARQQAIYSGRRR